jgi:hypothetical protein
MRLRQRSRNSFSGISGEGVKIYSLISTNVYVHITFLHGFN